MMEQSRRRDTNGVSIDLTPLLASHRMDPLSIAATIGSITTACFKAGKAICDVSCLYQDAPRSLVAMSSETAVIGVSLSHIQALISTQPKLGDLLRSRPDVRMALDTCLTGSIVRFSCLDDELRKILKHTRGKDKLSSKGKAKTVWKHETLQELLDGLRGQQTSLSTLIQLLQM